LLAARWTPLEAVLEEAGKTRKFSHIDALIEQSTGAALPVAALFDWLHGKPGQQQGWRADLGQLPQGRISAQRSKPLPRADLRIVLDRPAP
jgi:outer membrane lipoprotein LolB